MRQAPISTPKTVFLYLFIKHSLFVLYLVVLGILRNSSFFFSFLRVFFKGTVHLASFVPIVGSNWRKITGIIWADGCCSAFKQQDAKLWVAQRSLCPPKEWKCARRKRLTTIRPVDHWPQQPFFFFEQISPNAWSTRSNAIKLLLKTTLSRFPSNSTKRIFFSRSCAWVSLIYWTDMACQLTQCELAVDRLTIVISNPKEGKVAAFSNAVSMSCHATVPALCPVVASLPQGQSRMGHV